MRAKTVKSKVSSNITFEPRLNLSFLSDTTLCIRYAKFEGEICTRFERASKRSTHTSSGRTVVHVFSAGLIQGMDSRWQSLDLCAYSSGGASRPFGLQWRNRISLAGCDRRETQNRGRLAYPALRKDKDEERREKIIAHKISCQIISSAGDRLVGRAD
jgi:hypothetical protein